ncbi:MAG: NUDIX domain-containing protein [Acidobacteria bacterium]|nr:NUDIX domain-containing protein [Acidobacteriota bacterium]MCA1612138.1 NUDIX domain-containing protein [Acidobacteriota bacterium]
MERDRGLDDWANVPVFGRRPESEVSIIRPSAYILMEVAGGRLAVVRTWEGTFLPGGGIEAGEDVRDAILREAVEECGLVVVPGGWAVRAVQLAWSPSIGAHLEKRSTFVDGSVIGPAATPAEPGHEVLRVEPSTALRRLSHESHCWAVEQWLSVKR